MLEIWMVLEMAILNFLKGGHEGLSTSLSNNSLLMFSICRQSILGQARRQLSCLSPGLGVGSPGLGSLDLRLSLFSPILHERVRYTVPFPALSRSPRA